MPRWNTRTFEIELAGTDASGHPWTQTVTGRTVKRAAIREAKRWLRGEGRADWQGPAPTSADVVMVLDGKRTTIRQLRASRAGAGEPIAIADEEL